jgi:hypothetical protein
MQMKPEASVSHKTNEKAVSTPEIDEKIRTLGGLAQYTTKNS